MKILIHNLINDKDNKLIKCKICKHINKKSINWDYQKCIKCKNYLYDYRC